VCVCVFVCARVCACECVHARVCVRTCVAYRCGIPTGDDRCRGPKLIIVTYIHIHIFEHEHGVFLLDPLRCFLLDPPS